MSEQPKRQLVAWCDEGPIGEWWHRHSLCWVPVPFDWARDETEHECLADVIAKTPAKAAEVAKRIEQAFAAEAALDALRAQLGQLKAKWEAEAAAKDTFHATMGIGWKSCVKDLAVLLDPPSRKET